MKFYSVKILKERQAYFVVANTNIEALATLFSETGLTFDDLDYEDEIVEIATSDLKEKWSRFYKETPVKYSQIIGKYATGH